MKIIAIGGEPGSGKSTMMKELMEGKLWRFESEYPLVPYYVCGDVIVLGKYEDDGYAQGTDKMSMACQPKVIEFLKTLRDDIIVMFEGDRLFSPSFLEHCVENYDTQIVILRTEKDVRTNRYEERGSSQNLTWLTGRETKISNIRNNFLLRFNITQMDNNNFEEQKDTLLFLRKMIYGEENNGMVGP